MRVILFGASGMVGQGALTECLLADDVSEVLAVVRARLGVEHAKLRQLQREDFFNFEPLAETLTGFDACFFCLGVSSFRTKEEAYTRLTFDLTMAAARVLARVNPGMIFVYISGARTDGTEQGGTMWARVKGRTENALLALPFRAAYMFRPGVIQPLGGIRSKTPVYHLIYSAMGPLFPLLRMVAGRYIATTGEVGRAMLRVAREQPPQRVLENDEIIRLGR